MPISIHYASMHGNTDPIILCCQFRSVRHSLNFNSRFALASTTAIHKIHKNIQQNQKVPKPIPKLATASRPKRRP